VIFATLILASEATGGVNLPSWLEWGVLGVVIVAIVMTKQLVPGWIYAELKQENRELKDENKELVAKLLALSETALPAIKESNTVVAEVIREIRNMRDSRSP